MKDTNVWVMGTQYDVLFRRAEEDDFLIKERCDGYCDCTSYRIVIRKLDENDCIDNEELHMHRVLRHEIIHAFLFESGLGAEIPAEHGHNELYVDFFARQWGKIQKAFKDIGCSMEVIE